MRILCCGDVHGNVNLVRKAYKKFKQGKYDKLVFIGDYADSFNYSDDEIYDCVSYVLSLSNNPNIITLLGNHDFHYLFPNISQCSGYRPKMAFKLQLLFEEYFKNNQLKLFHIEDNVLFTHAGMRNDWYDKLFKLFSDKLKGTMLHKEDVENTLTMMYESLSTEMLFLISSVGKKRGGFDTPGIMWSDYLETISNPYFDSKITCQIFGHTHCKDIRIAENQNNVCFCIDNPNKFLEYDTETREYRID